MEASGGNVTMTLKVKVFSNDKPTTVRVPILTDGTTYDWDAKSKVQKSIPKVTRCMTNL